MIAFEFPLRTGRGQNDRMHWRAKNRQKKSEREATAWAIRQKVGTPTIDPCPALPLTVTLTRIAPSGGLDDDNLSGSMKSIRDQIAAWLGVDDADPRVAYRYAQRRGPWAVGVSIEKAKEAGNV